MKTLAKWSIDDYHHMIKAGILQGRQVELLAGEIVEMSPETPIHYATAQELLRRLPLPILQCPLRSFYQQADNSTSEPGWLQL